MKSYHIGIFVLLSAIGCTSAQETGKTEQTGPVTTTQEKNTQPLQVQYRPLAEELVTRPSHPAQGQTEVKNDPVTAVIHEENGTRPPVFADVIRLQKAVVAHSANSEAERQRLAVLYLLGHELLAAEELLHSVTPPLDPFMELASVYLSDHLGEHREADQRLKTFLNHWKQQKGLTIGRSLLCEKVDGYRRYVPSPSSVVPAGTSALVYLELHDFTLKQNQDRHVLHLRYGWELLDEKGTAVPVEWLQKVKLEAREAYVEFNDEVSDHHQNFIFPLPQNLPMGKYSIRITAEDAHSGKKASTAVEFHVQAR